MLPADPPNTKPEKTNFGKLIMPMILNIANRYKPIIGEGIMPIQNIENAALIMQRTITLLTQYRLKNETANQRLSGSTD